MCSRLLRIMSLFCLAFGLSLSGAAAQSDFPSRAVTMVVPLPAGSPSDVMARIIGDGLSDYWKQPVVVLNRVGASGAIGAESVANAKPDGYTILLALSGPIGQLEVMRPDTTRFRSLTSFRTIGRISNAPVMIWARSDLGVKNAADLVKLAKSRPGQLHYATSGVGTTSHLAMELFKTIAGIDLVHVPYTGGPGAVQAVIGGQVDLLVIGAVGTFDILQQSGKAVGIASVSTQRYPGAPELQTLIEQGFAGANLDGWWGLVAPAGTPDDVMKKLESSLLAVMSDKTIQARISATGAQPLPGDGKALTDTIRNDIEKVGRLMKETNLKVE